LIKVDVCNVASSAERFSMRVKTTGKVLFRTSKALRAEDALYNYTRALTKLNEAKAYSGLIISEGVLAS